jgi:uncharacterized protein (TIGR04255 family)
MRLHDSSVRGDAVKYSNPPVVETVLSVQFDPLPNLGAGQLGSYWKTLGDDWPHVTDVPAVDPVYERFETSKMWEPPALGFKFSQKMDLRLQIRNRTTKDRMIQIQNGRFFYNWLGTPRKAYPSYESVRPEFDEQWDRFREYVISQADNNAVRPNQWEILYVNHIPRGTAWNKLAELPEVLTFLSQPNFEHLGLTPEGIGGEWRFEIQPKKGRLYISLGLKVSEDGTPCIVMTLTARGPIVDGSISLDDGLEIGHKTITEAFDRLTSSKAQHFWGVQHADG